MGSRLAWSRSVLLFLGNDVERTNVIDVRRLAVLVILPSGEIEMHCDGISDPYRVEDPAFFPHEGEYRGVAFVFSGLTGVLVELDGLDHQIPLGIVVAALRSE